MIFMINITIMVFVLFVVAIQIHKYNQIVFDKYRFKYFALRDRLAMLVVNHKLEEDSWEYQGVIDAINFHIRTIEGVSISKIISLLIKYHVSPEEERKVKIIKKKVDHPEVLEIMADFMETTASLLECNSRIQIALLKRFSKKEKSKHPGNLGQIASHKAALDKVRSYRDELRSSLGNRPVMA